LKPQRINGKLKFDMLINADPAKRVVVNTNDLPWVDSPLPGVKRRMLERDGDEVARATSLVRYAPGSAFSPHTHGGGEEFLVLDGVFSDEHGDYPAGTYVRNPAGSTHQPSSKNGCTIFVKLCQMEIDDQERVRIDTRTGEWSPGAVAGSQRLRLHAYGTEEVELMRLEPEVRLPSHTHSGGEEILVLDGVLEDERGRYPEGTWLRNPPGSRHAPASPAGCVIYIKRGHLGPEVVDR
jgi:anti-sigma factor ChrR (cupin superfamily)